MAGEGKDAKQTTGKIEGWRYKTEARLKLELWATYTTTNQSGPSGNKPARTGHLFGSALNLRGRLLSVDLSGAGIQVEEWACGCGSRHAGIRGCSRSLLPTLLSEQSPPKRTFHRPWPLAAVGHCASQWVGTPVTPYRASLVRERCATVKRHHCKGSLCFGMRLLALLFV